MQNKTTRKLKPFDLEAAKRGDPVVTRDGHAVRIICFDRKGGHPIVFLLTSYDGSIEWIYTADNQGRVVGPPSKNLFMATKKKYLNIYRDPDSPDGFMVAEFNDRDAADRWQKKDGSRLACVEIEE